MSIFHRAGLYKSIPYPHLELAAALTLTILADYSRLVPNGDVLIHADSLGTPQELHTILAWLNNRHKTLIAINHDHERSRYPSFTVTWKKKKYPSFYCTCRETSVSVSIRGPELLFYFHTTTRVLGFSVPSYDFLGSWTTVRPIVGIRSPIVWMRWSLMWPPPGYHTALTLHLVVLVFWNPFVKKKKKEALPSCFWSHPWRS